LIIKYERHKNFTKNKSELFESKMPPSNNGFENKIKQLFKHVFIFSVKGTTIVPSKNMTNGDNIAVCCIPLR
jgi:hypothetical protein